MHVGKSRSDVLVANIGGEALKASLWLDALPVPLKHAVRNERVPQIMDTRPLHSPRGLKARTSHRFG